MLVESRYCPSRTKTQSKERAVRSNTDHEQHKTRSSQCTPKHTKSLPRTLPDISSRSFQPHSNVCLTANTKEPYDVGRAWISPSSSRPHLVNITRIDQDTTGSPPWKANFLGFAIVVVRRLRPHRYPWHGFVASLPVLPLSTVGLISWPKG